MGKSLTPNTTKLFAITVQTFKISASEIGDDPRFAFVFKHAFFGTSTS